MIIKESGMSFNEYINELENKNQEKFNNIYNSIVISKSQIEKIKSINHDVGIIVFSEEYCPDCITTLPLLKKIIDINGNLTVNVFSRRGNENYLMETTGEARVPTIISTVKNIKYKGVYVEFPEILREKMINSSEEEKINILKDFREGKYSNNIIEEIINILKK